MPWLFSIKLSAFFSIMLKCCILSALQRMFERQIVQFFTWSFRPPGAWPLQFHLSRKSLYLCHIFQKHITRKNQIKILQKPLKSQDLSITANFMSKLFARKHLKRKVGRRIRTRKYRQVAWSVYFKNHYFRYYRYLFGKSCQYKPICQENKKK